MLYTYILNKLFSVLELEKYGTESIDKGHIIALIKLLPTKIKCSGRPKVTILTTVGLPSKRGKIKPVAFKCSIVRIKQTPL